MNNVAAQFERKGMKASIICLAMVMVLMIPALALCDQESGLEISLHTKDGNTRFTLDDATIPVTFEIQVKNNTQWPINAPRDISQIELHRALVITDPGGKKHILAQEEVATDMPPPLFSAGKETAPAEILDTNWVRTVEIELGNIFRMIKARPGVYTIEARQPFTRFPWTIKDEALGLMGIVDELDPKYWKGDVESQNILKIIVVPNRGGRFNLRLLDLGLNSPVGQAQVRVYRAEDIPEEMTEKEIWDTQAPVIAGSSDFQGWAAWEDGQPCMPEGEYRAVGYYQEEYKAVDFESGIDEWGDACAGLLERRIYFNEPQLYEFSVFGLNSVDMGYKSRVLSGDVGADGTGDGYEIVLDSSVKVKEGVSIRGESISIGEDARVWDVYYYDEILNNGSIVGETAGSTALPIWQGLPSLFPADFHPGSTTHASDRRIG